MTISKAELSDDSRTVVLHIPGLTTTRCYEITAKLRDADGSKITRSLHGTIHSIKEK